MPSRAVSVTLPVRLSTVPARMLPAVAITALPASAVAPPESAPFPERLLHLLEHVGAICADHGCEEAAIEEVFVNVNPSSTLKLGHARAAVMLAPAKAGLPVAEYSATLIKKAVVGAGHADKSQIAFMVKRLLPASGEVKADAADALAVAVTHAHHRRFRTAALRGAA